jgi:hypothetical protein
MSSSDRLTQLKARIFDITLFILFIAGVVKLLYYELLR